jgi:hypothetical protein
MIEGDATQVVWWARENENRLNASLDLEQRCCPPAQKEKLAGLVLACTDRAAVWAVPYVNRKHKSSSQSDSESWHAQACSCSFTVGQRNRPVVGGDFV